MHLYLIGYRGSGKSSVGREVASLMQWEAVDSDDWVEKHAMLTIREIFEKFGESHFRQLESDAIQEISAGSVPLVVSLGGGAVLKEANRRMLQETGMVVWLEASPEQLVKRIAADATTIDRRPALTKLAGFEEIVSVLAKREPIYRELANKVVMTDNRSPIEIADEIVGWFRLQ